MVLRPMWVGGITFMLSVTAILRIQNRLTEYGAYHSDDIFDFRLSMTSHHKGSQRRVMSL